MDSKIEAKTLSKWRNEIKDSITSSHIFSKLKFISKDLGPLGILIFLRLHSLQQIVIDKADAGEVEAAKDQLSLNNPYSRGGVPIGTDNFLVYVAERMMNIAQAHQNPMSASHMIRDKVFPPISELQMAIQKNKVHQHDQIIYKLLIDMYEVTCSNQKVLFENLCPASIKFYKKLT